MLSILLRATRRIQKTGHIHAADVARIVEYGNRHPMWSLCARPETIAAHNAILAQWKAATTARVEG